MPENESNKEQNKPKPFGFLQQTIKGKSPQQNLAPAKKTYVKPDGTKVTEEKSEFGTSVIEVCPDCTVIGNFYDTRDVLRHDYIRRANIELVHHYDEFRVKTDELTNVYDKDNKMIRQIEKVYEYHDNGKISQEETLESPEEIKTTIRYNENGEQIEKFVQRGTMTTWYDINEKPIKRQIDRGSGGIITEDL